MTKEEFEQIEKDKAEKKRIEDTENMVLGFKVLLVLAFICVLFLYINHARQHAKWERFLATHDCHPYSGMSDDLRILRGEGYTPNGPAGEPLYYCSGTEDPNLDGGWSD